MTKNISVFYMFFIQLKNSLKAKIPEKVLIFASYIVNFLLVGIHSLVLKEVGESIILVRIVDLFVAGQMLLPVIILDLVPLFHYMVLLVIILLGSIFDLVSRFPIYYYSIALITVATLIKLEPVFTTSPSMVKISTRVTRAVKKARIPKSRSEIIFSVKVSAIHIVSVLITAFFIWFLSYFPAVIVLVYNLLALLFFVLSVGANPLVEIPKAKYSTSLLFVMRYPFMFRIANRMKMKIHPLCERAGIWIYEVKYVSKYIVMFVWYIMFLPTLFLLTYSLLPREVFLFFIPVLFMIPLIIYYIPFISLYMKIQKRKSDVEKEYPMFLAYASTLVSAGYSLYSVFKDLTTSRGAQLLKAFSREAKYLVALVENQGFTELRALERYAATHPSSEVRNFVLGYMHQVQLGGRLSTYLDQKLIEALDALRRRMENFVNQVVTLTEIALTVLVIPALPTVIGFIIAPDIVYNMLFLQLFVFVPAVGMMFYFVANTIELEFRDEYRFTYVPSVLSGLAGLLLSFYVFQQKVLAGISVVVGAISLGYYIEYVRQRRTFNEIEKTLPQFFRDLSELRNVMSISEAIERMTEMNYPKSVLTVLRKASNLRNQGIKFSEQPWHNKSWFWRFSQFLIGKIEESGGGTSELFRQLMFFFTEFNNIMSAVRSNLRVYEFVIYAIPAIFGLVTYSTLGIFVTMSEVSKTIGGGEASEALMNLGLQFPQLVRIFQGVDPIILTINDAIIFEMSLILGLLGGKIISGTLKDTRPLFVVMIIAMLVILFAPQFTELLMKHGMTFSP